MCPKNQLTEAEINTIDRERAKPINHVDQLCDPFGIYPRLLGTISENSFSYNEGGEVPRLKIKDL